jgi:hypothetical protein
MVCVSRGGGLRKRMVIALQAWMCQPVRLTLPLVACGRDQCGTPDLTHANMALHQRSSAGRHRWGTPWDAPWPAAGPAPSCCLI